MITIGVDAHKTLHVAVAVDSLGRKVSDWSGGNTVAEWSRFGEWLAGLGTERQVGIEGASSYGYGLSRALIAAGEQVYEVNSRLTARERRHAVRRGKSDELDALAVCQAVLREGERLPSVVHSEGPAILAHLAEERESLVGEATRVRNQLHAVLLMVDPEYKATEPSLRSKQAIARLEAYEEPAGATPLVREYVGSVRRYAARLSALMAESDALGKRIEGLAREKYEPLTKISGISFLTAGTLAGILGTHAGFKSDANLASYAGVAPLPASSAGNGKHRLSRVGNRRLNAIVYRIAIAQMRHPGAGRTYIDGRMKKGHEKRDAIRSLKRYITRAIWRQWQACMAPPAAEPTETRASFACPGG